ncbi:hypothetical protein OA180_01155 [Candidatus Pelagibacter sp.]|nr:hypothetical protein [Candidatus Pelagibacter sp.]
MKKKVTKKKVAKVNVKKTKKIIKNKIKKVTKKVSTKSIKKKSNKKTVLTPTEPKVEAILEAIRPLLPTPQKITFD